MTNQLITHASTTTFATDALACCRALETLARDLPKLLLFSPISFRPFHSQPLFPSSQPL
ncbi:hypothetical protein KJ835_01635 [Patescibacteria group bacterium]|nr:hypothetical protein [Patescibacteria group bacterium]